MKSKQVTQFEGEDLGPVDWNYDFAAHGWTEHHGGINPQMIPEMVTRLKEIEHGEWGPLGRCSRQAFACQGCALSFHVYSRLRHAN